MTWDDLNVSFSKALASVLFSPFHPRTLDHVWHAFKSNLFVCFHDHLPKRHISPVSPSTLPREQFTMMLQLKLLNHLKKELLNSILLRYQFNVSFHSASFTNFKRAFEAREDNFLHKQGQFITSAINRDRSIGPSQSPYKSLSSLPLRWSSRYQPVDLLSDDIYDSVISLISLDKFCSTIRTLPCGKAAGPSGIPYEAFKHLSENNLSWLLRLFNDCLLTGNIPTEWRNASIYPIPKPTQFDVMDSLSRYHYTDDYPVLIGMDQSEVISSLLWVIYLDPLLTKLNDSNPAPYCLSSSSTAVHHLSHLTYMDDFTLIASSKHDLETLLSIAHEFYFLNNISANLAKYVLITTHPDGPPVVSSSSSSLSSSSSRHFGLYQFFCNFTREEIESLTVDIFVQCGAFTQSAILPTTLFWTISSSLSFYAALPFQLPFPRYLPAYIAKIASLPVFGRISHFMSFHPHVVVRHCVPVTDCYQTSSYLTLTPCNGCALNQLAPNNTERYCYSDLPICLLVAKKVSFAIIPFTSLNRSHSAPKLLGCSIGLLQDLYLPLFPIGVDCASIPTVLPEPSLDSFAELLEQVYTPKIGPDLVPIFEFYTDSSVKDYGSSSCHAGVSWVQVIPDKDLPISSYSANISLTSLTSLRMEIMAVISALISLLLNSHVIIHTDSQSIINFFFVGFSSLSSLRARDLNCQKHLLWLFISFLMDSQNLSLHLVKESSSALSPHMA
ncbi:L1Tc protein [Rhizophagus clarus]|uniref:L1Tc protein n=1 Tax=Rhizophagus clarus TaxID=94130 RepID=A0A8H3M245_9GLOM|nr:L1Tc protein [Rhizophagus clarus]